MAFLGDLANELVKAVHLDLFPEQYGEVFGMGSSDGGLNSNVLGTWQIAMIKKLVKLDDIKEALIDNRVNELFYKATQTLGGGARRYMYPALLLQQGLGSVEFAPPTILQGPPTLLEYLEEMGREADDAMDAVNELNHPWSNRDESFNKLHKCKRDVMRMMGLGYRYGGIAHRVLKDIRMYIP